MLLKNWLLGGVVGSLVYFFVGWVVHDMFLKEFLVAHGGLTPSAMRTESLTLYSLAGYTFLGFLLTYLLLRTHLQEGLSALVFGGLFGLLLRGAVLLQVYATTTVYSKTGLAADLITFSIISSLAAVAIRMVTGFAEQPITLENESPEIEWPQ